jgi:hypothetical protein
LGVKSKITIDNKERWKLNMPMFGVNNIHMPDGRLLGEVLEEIKNGLGGGKGESVDLKDYAKVSDVKEVKTMVEQLIADLKAGKYNISSEISKADVKEDKASK